MNFAVYSKDGCPYCTKVVQVLELAKLNHVVYKLGNQFNKDAFYGEFGKPYDLVSVSCITIIFAVFLKRSMSIF